MDGLSGNLLFVPKLCKSKKIYTDSEFQKIVNIHDKVG